MSDSIAFSIKILESYYIIYEGVFTMVTKTKGGV